MVSRIPTATPSPAVRCNAASCFWILRFKFLYLSLVAVADDPPHMRLQFAKVSEHPLFKICHGYTSRFKTVE